jgi:hypothetical protein
MAPSDFHREVAHALLGGDKGAPLLRGCCGDSPALFGACGGWWLRRRRCRRGCVLRSRRSQHGDQVLFERLRQRALFPLCEGVQERMGTRREPYGARLPGIPPGGPNHRLELYPLGRREVLGAPLLELWGRGLVVRELIPRVASSCGLWPARGVQLGLHPAVYDRDIGGGELVACAWYGSLLCGATCREHITDKRDSTKALFDPPAADRNQLLLEPHYVS